MARFVIGDDRSQSTLFPERLDDYLGEDNPVRAIDVFVGELDLAKLGFDGVEPEATGRPAYHPATLLKIYVYGYLNRVQSSRRLERECQRNIELVWLTGHLMPDFKTIADFRKDNGDAIPKVCREFVVLCRRLELFSEGERCDRRQQVQSGRHGALQLHAGQVRWCRPPVDTQESITGFRGHPHQRHRPPAVGCQWKAQGGVDLALGAGLQARHPQAAPPFACAGSRCTSRIMCSISGTFGFTSRAITLAWGTNSESSSNRFGFRSAVRKLTPVGRDWRPDHPRPGRRW